LGAFFQAYPAKATAFGGGSLLYSLEGNVSQMIQRFDERQHMTSGILLMLFVIAMVALFRPQQSSSWC
jgi:hypothetical protein